ncbi:chromatin-remodeling ATPase INO80 [Coregonus clupeaformis]|uniref:chromatin-remodeling ATPase INO80 n=1 Tax=Coregonus clupeaformis TaxID=59861 RepID=UPI001E1C6528|nr:chromatin-remodeling ATPase INO80 [Coregonus clupeaformis]XP_045069634.1 chromatin-remodeling ATPase INO80 [Coregonus clupeaformis]XP_045069635.1 chromatin-remodeling ATPase INO80 [Coregonus clupeaformis]
MASGAGQAEADDGAAWSSSGLAKPLHLQHLERSLRLDSFLRQTASVFNRDLSSDDSDDGGLGEGPSMGPTNQHAALAIKEESCDLEEEGLVTEGNPLNGALSQEHKADKDSLYNFSKLKKSRKWLKSILLSDDTSESDTEESDFSLSREELQDMLRLHQFTREHQNKFHNDRELQQYQYYSTGLLSSQDPFYEQQRHLLGPKKKKIKEEKKFKGKLKKGKKKKKRVEGEFSGEGRPYVTKIFAKFSHDAPLPMLKKKHLTVEQLNARRRKVWLTIAKKECPKAFKQKASAKNFVLTNAKKLAHQCMREVRRAAIQAQKNCKETLPRARRLTKEMTLYWKKYEKVEKEHRKRAEKEALEQRKLDEEMREAKRQQRKLNFLITQTELYAHFMGGKGPGEDGEEEEGGQEDILNKLDDTTSHRQMDIGGGVMVNVGQEDYDSEYYKSQALRNAKEAYDIHQARTRLFDEEAKDSRCASLHQASGSGSGFGESYSLSNPSIQAGEDIPQPTIFNGKLKGYQLKGMNWLANLYEQGINGILADEMGLGKTVQSIALLGHLAERDNIWGPFLIISPASTLNNWHQEFTRFVPKFKVLPYWGNPHDRKVIRKFWSQKTLYTQNAPFHVVITSYQLVVQDVKYFQRVKWQYMVLDEAQALKSSTSVRWKILLQFQCRNRLLLTGTPIQNTMAELWALLHFIMPTLFDSHEEFNEWFSKDIESHAENKSAIDENQLSRLHMILKPFMLRRIKKDVENELSDKIEILTYCQLTCRQRLLYRALRNKISIEDLLQSSMGSSQQAHNTTSSLMNLVMQFRKVCNHPDLFERQETRSPFHMSLRPYIMSKFLYRNGLISTHTHSRNKLLQVLLSPFSPDHIQQSLFHRKGDHEGSCFSFLRFINVSPAEMSNVMLQGTVVRWLALFLSLKEAYRLHQRRMWGLEDGEGNGGRIGGGEEDGSGRPRSQCLSRRGLILWLDRPTAFPNTHTSTVLQDLVFTRHRPGLMGHCDVLVHSRHSANSTTLRPGLPTQPPKFLLTAVPRVTAVPMERYCDDRSAEYEWQETLAGGGMAAKQCFLYGSPDLASDWMSRANAFYPRCPGGVMALYPRHGWSYIRIPDKETLITDSGKLHTLDLLLCRLKAQGHRVLIYSQMTRMIDLLEEYMVYRKHTYMRLDGSSKISERRDMVADFQSRTDIFVFLLSTRAGGLGINLTAADTVIFYDSDWNPTVDQQAMDRAHRLGQTKQVTVYRLICQLTIEERILQRAKEKSEIQRMVISGGNFKPDTLKPKEVVSLLLDDEELEKRLRVRQEEKRQQEECSKVKDRKRKREKYADKRKKDDEDPKRRKEVNLVIPYIPSADNSNLSADGDDSFISVDMDDSAMPSPFSEISLSSELQPSSLPPDHDPDQDPDPDQDESSSDMLVIVDDPVSSAPQSRATNSPVSVSGSMSDNMNGVSTQDTSSPGTGRSGRSRGRPGSCSGAGAKSAGKGRVRKSTAGSAAAIAGAMAGAAAASAAYAAYGYSGTKAGLPAASPLQPSLGRSGTAPAFSPSSSSSPKGKGGAVAPSPQKQPAPSQSNPQQKQPGHSHHHSHGHVTGRKGKGPGGPGAPGAR